MRYALACAFALAFSGCHHAGAGSHADMDLDLGSSDGGGFADMGVDLGNSNDGGAPVDAAAPPDLGRVSDLAEPAAAEPPPGFSLYAARGLAIQTTQIAAGDLDVDGRPDLVTAWGGSVVSVMRNVDGWSFATPVNYDLGSNAIIGGLAVGDLDGDGKPEIVAAANMEVAVLHNQGDGTFAAAASYSTSNSVAVALGDVDGDGKPDLVVAAGYDVETLHNRGDGTFDAAVTHPGVPSPAAIVLADLDGNGSLDVAEASSEDVYVGGQNIEVLLNDGHGTFGTVARYPGSTAARSLVAADFNGDGHSDLVVVDNGAPPSTGVVHVLLNQGNGTFVSGASAVTDSLAEQVAVADFDDDGDLDLAVMTQWHNKVSVLTNNGDATFAVAGEYFVTGGAGIVAADFNGDHLADIAAAGSATALLFNHGHDTFIAAAEQLVPYTGTGLAVGDVDGDGKVDAVVASSTENGGGSDQVSVLLHLPDGTLGPPTKYAAGKWVEALAVGDLDGDGDLDVVAADNYDNTISVLINDGHGVYGAPTAYAAGAGPMSLALADFDGDGALDVAVGHFGEATVSVLRNDGHGAFGAATAFAVGNKPKRIAAGDLDGNGTVDVVSVNYDDNTITVLLNQGNAAFASGVTYAAGISPSSIALGDLDGDADLDIAVTHDYQYGEDDIGVLANDGHGALAPAVTYQIGGSQGDLTIGDIDGDGHADLVFRWWSGSLGVMLSDGKGGFGAPYGFVAGGASSPVLVDFDADRRTDVVAIGVDNCSVLLNSSH